jgi:hypothetical protein
LSQNQSFASLHWAAWKRAPRCHSPAGFAVIDEHFGVDWDVQLAPATSKGALPFPVIRGSLVTAEFSARACDDFSQSVHDLLPRFGWSDFHFDSGFGRNAAPPHPMHL